MRKLNIKSLFQAITIISSLFVGVVGAEAANFGSMPTDDVISAAGTAKTSYNPSASQNYIAAMAMAVTWPEVTGHVLTMF